LGIVQHEKLFYFYQVNCSSLDSFRKWFGLIIWVKPLPSPAGVFFVNFLNISYPQTIDVYLKVCYINPKIQFIKN